MRNILIYLLLIGNYFALTGCSYFTKEKAEFWLPRVHKVDVQQGNIIDQEDVNRLRPGMSKAQVRFIMGTPLINDTFHEDRWDYIYTFKPGYGVTERRQMTLFFDNDNLINFVGDMRPGEPTAKQRVLEEVVVVPLEEYQPEDESKKSWYRKFIDFFEWTDEHRGIPSDGDIPVKRAPGDDTLSEPPGPGA